MRFPKFIQMGLILALLALALTACALPAPPQAQEQPALTGDALRVENAWARPSPMAAGNGAIYLVIVNPTDQADRLVAAASPAAEHTELHETVNDGGVMRMEPRPEGFVVEPKSIVELKPGGKHIMLLGLKEPLETGQEIQVTLTFEKAGEITVTAPVKEMAQGMEMDQKMDKEMDKENK